VPVEGHIHVWEGGIQVLLELAEGELVTFLELFVIGRKLLVAVVGQVDEFAFAV
jgi:hypothetical protein